MLTSHQKVPSKSTILSHGQPLLRFLSPQIHFVFDFLEMELYSVHSTCLTSFTQCNVFEIRLPVVHFFFFYCLLVFHCHAIYIYIFMIFSFSTLDCRSTRVTYTRQVLNKYQLRKNINIFLPITNRVTYTDAYYKVGPGSDSQNKAFLYVYPWISINSTEPFLQRSLPKITSYCYFIPGRNSTNNS